jgi:hypothetical protein
MGLFPKNVCSTSSVYLYDYDQNHIWFIITNAMKEETDIGAVIDHFYFSL